MEQLEAGAAAAGAAAGVGVATPPARRGHGGSVGHIATPPMLIRTDLPVQRGDGGSGGGSGGGGGGGGGGGSGSSGDDDVDCVVGSGGRWPPSSWSFSPAGRDRHAAASAAGVGGGGDNSGRLSGMDAGSSGDSSIRRTRADSHMATSIQPSSSLSASLQERFTALRADLLRLRSFFATDGEEDSHGSEGGGTAGRSSGRGRGAADESFFSTGDGGGEGGTLSRHPSLMPAPGGFDDNAAKLRLEVMTAGEVNFSIGALYVTLLAGLAYTLIATGVASASWMERPDGASAAAVATGLAPSLLSRAAAVTINVAGVGVAALFLLALAAIPSAERTEEQVWTAVLLGAGLLCTSPMTLAGLPTDLPGDTPVMSVAITRTAAAALRSLLAPAWPAAAGLFPPLSTAGLLRILTDAVYTASATFYLLSASHSYRLLLRPGSQLERARFYGPKVAAVVAVFLIKGVLAAAAGVSLGFVPFARMLSVFRLARVGELPPLVGAAALAAVVLDAAIAFSTLSAMRATGHALAAQPYAETRTKQLGFRCFAYQTPACATAMICLRLLTIVRLPIEVLVLTARPPPPSLADASLVPPVANLGIAAVYLTSTTLAAYMNLPAGLWRDVEVATALAATAELQPSSAGDSELLGPPAASSSTALAPSLAAGGRVPLLLERSLARVFFTAVHRVFSGRDQPAVTADGDNPERVPLLAGDRRRRVRLPSSALSTAGKGIPWGRDMPLRYRHREWRVLNGGVRDDAGGWEGVSRGGRLSRPARGFRQRREFAVTDSSSTSDMDAGDDGGSRVALVRRSGSRSQRHRRRRRRRGFVRNQRPPPPSMVGTYPSGPATSVGSFGDYLGDEPVVGPDLQRGLLSHRSSANRFQRQSTFARWERSLLDADPDRGCYFRLGMKKNVLVMQTVVLMVNCAYLAYIPGNAREELVPPPPSPPRPPRPPPRPPPPASVATEGADELEALLTLERHDLLHAGRGGGPGNSSSMGGLDTLVRPQRAGDGGGVYAPFAMPSVHFPLPSAPSLAVYGGGTTASGSDVRQAVSQPHSWSRLSSMAPALDSSAATDTWGRRPLGASSRVPSLMSSPALDTWGRRSLLPSTGHSSIDSPELGAGVPGRDPSFGVGRGRMGDAAPGRSAGGSGRGFGGGDRGSTTASTGAATAAVPGTPASFASADGLRIDPFALAASRGYLVARYITAPSLSAHALVLVSVDRVVVTFSGTRDATNWAANLEVSSTPFDDLFSDELPLDPAIYADRGGGGAAGRGGSEKGAGGAASSSGASTAPFTDGAASSSAAAPAAAAATDVAAAVDGASYGSVSSGDRPRGGIDASPSLFAGGGRPVSEDKVGGDGLPPPASSGGLAAFAKDVLTLGQASVHGGHARVYKRLRPDVLSVIANLYAPPEGTAWSGAGARRRCGGSGAGGAQEDSLDSSSNGGGGRDWTHPGESSDAGASLTYNQGGGDSSIRDSLSSSDDDDSSDDSSGDTDDSSMSFDSHSHGGAVPPPSDPYSARTAYVASRWRGRGRGKPIFFTGHSMGGSLATLASYEAARHWRQLGLASAEDVAVTTFGAPRVGNSAFALRYDATVATHWRVVLAADPVVRQPRLLGYHHVGVEVLLDRAGRLVVDPSFVETAWWASSVGAATGYRLHFRASYVLAVKAACRAYRGGRDDLAEDFWPFVLGEHVHRLFRVSNAESVGQAGGGGRAAGASTAAGADQV